MPESTTLPYLRESLLFLALAGVLIPLLRRLRISPVFGFLILGAVLGPFGLGSLGGTAGNTAPALAFIIFPRIEGVVALAELGVVFLMFSIGLELSFERLATMRRWVLGAGMAQMLITGVVIAAIAVAFGNARPAAIVIGFALAFSSTALVMQLLSERQESVMRHGRAAFGVLLLQDLAVVPLLILVGVLSTRGGALAPTIGIALAKGLIAIGVIYVLGKAFVRPLFRAVVSPGQPDAFFALTMLTTLGIAGLTWLAGLSMALGALLAGLLLSETEYRHEIEASIEPFKGLLLGLFFFTVGMGFDLRALAREPVWLPLSVLGLFAVKAAILLPILRFAGLDLRRAIATSALLGQAGEFGFVIVAAGVLAGVITRDAGQFVLLIIGLSMLATPAVDRIGRWIAGHVEHAASDRDDEIPVDALEGHVVLAGYGRVGRMLGRLMEGCGVQFVAIENDPDAVSRGRGEHQHIHFGDASRPELLRHFRLDRAAAVVLTMNHPGHALRAVKALRREYPGLRILARAHDEIHAAHLREAGADEVIPETLESGLRLGALAMDAAGVDNELVERLVDNERARL